MPTIEEKLQKAARQLAGVAENQLTKSDVDRLLETAVKLGPEGLKKAAPFMSAKQRTILTNVLKKAKADLSKGEKAHTVNADLGPRLNRDLLSRELTPGRSGADTTDEQFVHDENAEVRHQGDASPEGIEGQVIKGNEMHGKDGKFTGSKAGSSTETSSSNKQHQKGVHQSVSRSDAGTSNAGAHVAGHGYGANTDTAKRMHREKLAELQAMPAPKLGKSEQNPDEHQDADMAEKIERIVSEHMKDNAEAEKKEAAERKGSVSKDMNFQEGQEDMEKGSRVIGMCKSGKPIMHHYSNAMHKDFGAEDHRDAAEAHRAMMHAPHVQAQAKLGDKEAQNHHMEQAMKHHGAMLKCEMMAKDGMAGGGLAGGDGSSASGMVPVPPDMAKKCMHKSGEGCEKCMSKGDFQDMVNKLEHEKNPPRDPKAVAAKIGREELGQKEMTRRSVEGREKAEKSEESGAGDTQTLMRSQGKGPDAPTSNATETLQLSKMVAKKCLSKGLDRAHHAKIMKDLGHFDDGENHKAWEEAQAEHVAPKGTTAAPKNPEDAQSKLPPKLDKSGTELSAEAPDRLVEEEAQSQPPDRMKKSPDQPMLPRKEAPREPATEAPDQLLSEEAQSKPPKQMQKGEPEGPMPQHEPAEGDATQDDPKDAASLPPEMKKSVNWDWNHQLRSDRGGRNAHYPTNDLIAEQEAARADLKKAQGHFAPSEEPLAKAATPKFDVNEEIERGRDRSDEQVRLEKAMSAQKGRGGKFTVASFTEEELIASLNLKGAKAEAVRQVKASKK